MVPTEQKLLKMLSNNDVTFFIPPYQRNYEWTSEQCQAFLDDVKKTCVSNKQGKQVQHFFGTVTYFSSETHFGQPTKLVLIDGQQRITTTMLFLVAIRDISDDEKVKAYIDKKFLKNENTTSDQNEYKIKLKQVETDWEAYKNIILGETIEDSLKDSAVYRNYKWFISELNKMIEDGFDLYELIELGIDRFSVVSVQLEPDRNEWENPQEIFESMNSLGKPLSLADLVRNYLLLGLDAETQTDYYNKYWLKIEKTIPKQVSNFIRDYMQACLCKACPKATEANHKKLYAQFKNVFQNSNPEDLLSKLKNYASLYAYLTSNVSTGNKSIDNYLDDLKQINLTTANSFLMAMLSMWKEGIFKNQDVVDMLEAFTTYCFRRRFILGLTSAENKNFPLLTRRLEDLAKAEDKKRKMFEILASQESSMRLPNDIELARTIESMNFYNFNYSKFYLALVEEKITKSRPNLNDSNLQKEHIMPQTLNEEWKNELGDNYEAIHQELLNSIGNITLIRHNQELGNKSFENKKDVYTNHAGLQIAKTMITDKKKWNEEAIRERTQWLIQYLLDKVFVIPDDMRRTNNFNTKNRTSLSFLELQLIGEEIEFYKDPSIKALVVSDNEVKFEGKVWRLSPLTAEIYKRKGALNPSGSYSGSYHWAYDGIRLADIM